MSKHMNRSTGGLLKTMAMVGALLASSTVLAQGNSGNAPGKNKNLGHGNASNGVMAMVTANRQIFYDGDPLNIGVRFPRGAELVSSGEVDAHVLIFQPDTEIIVVPVSDVASEDNEKLFELDAVEIEALPEGVYQFGVVLTVPDGDPLNLADWYNGMLGLVSVKGLTVSGEPVDVDDDGDGMVDDDTDGDGFVDEDPVEEDPVEEDPVEEDPVDETPTEEETPAEEETTP